MINKEKIVQFNLMQLNILARSACDANNLELLEYVLTSSDLTQHAQMSWSNDYLLVSASKKNNLDIIRFLLTSPYLKESVDINYANGEPLYTACAYGHLDIVKYLLTSSELKQHANINLKKGTSSALSCAAGRGHLDIVKYLLISPELEQHADIHENNDNAFFWICENSQLHIAEYLIFEYGVTLTDSIKKHLTKSSRSEFIEKMFAKKMLIDGLEYQLPNKEHVLKNKI